MDKISPIKNRILQYLDYMGIAKTEFCEKTSISYANMKGKSLSSEIGGSQLCEILSVFPEISAEWLLTGKGNMLKGEVKAVADTPPLAEVGNSDMLNRIIDLSQEIGRLKREIEELKK